MHTRTLCNTCQEEHIPGFCPAHELNDSAESLFLQKKKALIWKDKTVWQKALTIMGLVFAGIMAIACGISTAAAFLTLGFLAAGPASYFLTALIFFAGAAMNWYIFKDAVPEILIDFFGKRKLLQGLFEIEGGCDLLSTDQQPSATTLSDLGLKSNSGYVRYNNQLYYVNKERKECSLLDKVTGQALTDFDNAMGLRKLTLNKSQRLSAKGISKASQLTGHSIISTSKKAAMGLGITLAVSVGATFGVLYYVSTFSLTAAFGFLATISAAFPPIAAVLAGVTLVCMTALMLKDIATLIRTENIWQKCKNYLYNMVDLSPRCELRALDKAPNKDTVQTMATNAAFFKVGSNLYYINKEENKYLEFDASTAQGVFDLMQPANWNATGTLATHETMKRIATKTGQKPKSVYILFSERLLTTLLTIVFIPLAALGLFMTMNACAPGLRDFFMTYIPRASATAVAICSGIIALGFAFVGQIAFTLRITVDTIATLVSAIFSKKQAAEAEAAPVPGAAPKQTQSAAARAWQIISKTGLHLLALINAVGNGLISMVGATVGSFALQLLSGIGGTWSSYAAGGSSVERSFKEESDEDAELTFKRFSSTDIEKSLQASSASTPTTIAATVEPLLKPQPSVPLTTVFSSARTAGSARTAETLKVAPLPLLSKTVQLYA